MIPTRRAPRRSLPSTLAVLALALLMHPKLSATSLLAYYEFEGDYAASVGPDATTDQNPGELSFVAGLSGQGLDINDPTSAGNSGGSVSIPIDANPAALPAVTFGGWLKVDSFEFDGFMALDNGGWDRGITVSNNASAPGFGIASGGAPTMVASINPGSWQFVVGTFDNASNQSVLYVGDDTAGTMTTQSASGSDTAGAGETSIELGRYDNQDLNAVVDDIFVFDDALSDHQVNAIRNLRLSSLDYSPSDAAGLFALFDTAGTGLVNGLTWGPISGLDANVPGRLNDLGGGQYTLVLADSGDGVTTVTGLFDPTSSDGDSLGDIWENFYFGDLSRDGTLDFDSDGSTDQEEWIAHTDPTDNDSDNDGLSDGNEATIGTDPLDADSDNDGWDDGEEVIAGTDPNNAVSNPGNIPPPPPPLPVFTASIPASQRDAVVVFNEIHFQPAGDDTTLEYIELYNQLVVDVDLSNWRIGGVDYNFPEGTILDGRSYLVVAKDPTALQAATGFANALGPYAGSLGNSGEIIRLFTQQVAFRSARGAGSPGETSSDLDGRRVMDEIDFRDTYPWPAGADGSGSTLAKLAPQTGTQHPTNWRASTQVNGTPGSENVFGTTATIAFNELSGESDANFTIELYNYGAVPVSLGGLVIASSDPAAPDYVLPPGSLAVDSYFTIDASTLGFSPADNNRLFLHVAGKLSLIDSVRVDDRALARSPQGTGRWLRPDVLSMGAANRFAISEDIVINEILYHAYPQREHPGAPPMVTDIVAIDFDSSWRYEATAGPAGLPANWEDSVHLGWPAGPGILARESATLGEQILTNITLAPPTITYYFETDFNFAGGTVDELILEHYIDDGAVFYLNGVELDRFNIPDGAVTPSTTAQPGVSDAKLGSFTISNPTLQLGSNRISIEVHQSTTGSTDVVFGAKVILRSFAQTGTPPVPYADRPEEWIELYNRGPVPVDLSAWKLSGGIGYDFPLATSIPSGGFLVVAKDAPSLAAKHPAATIVGNFSNRLGNGGDLIVLEDAVGNPVDEVIYHDSGHWHKSADGGGSSLELRNPEADNRDASSWASSNETARSSWLTYTYEGIAQDDGIGNNVYHEFLLGLLQAGELLLDDVSVIEDPGGTNIQFIQNGSFERDALGAVPDKWRCLGTHGSHRNTVVIDDPDQPGNQCVHVIATGSTEDKHNKLETTYANSERVVSGRSYRISFRAKWLSGSNQVNTRLYFNYLQKTHLLTVPDVWGTPGAPNSVLVANAGPTIIGFQHDPAVPDHNQAVVVFARVEDPNGIATVEASYSVNANPYNTVAMQHLGNGLYSGTIPPQSGTRLIRFHVRAEDSLGAESFFPPTAEKGGAFYRVQDNLADTTGLRHNIRLLISEVDRQFLMTNTNRLSNDRFAATVIENESTVYYDVGLRLKGSAFGRFNGSHHGFNLQFQPEHRFRGVHDSVSIERSPPLKEMFAKHLLNRAGGAFTSFYDDVAFIIPPTTGDRKVGLLSMSRHTESYFDSIFRNASEPGTLFNHELLYSPNGTDGGPEGLKRGNPYNHTNGMYLLEDRGFDKEPYRWGFQIRSARGRDDYSELVALNRAMELSGTALRDAVEPLIDVDQWMRCFAMASLNGTDDITGRLYPHNFRFYVRPTDRKIMVFQWDLDRSFNISSNASIPPYAGNLAKLFNIPQFRRVFDGQLQDLIQSTFNSTYTTPWASHLTTVLGQSQNALPGYVTNRANYVTGQLPSALNFRITTNGGNNFAEADSVVDLAGDAWIDVFSIRINGAPTPVTWTDANSWRITVPLAIGPNTLVITGVNNRGTEVGSDTIVVTNTSPVDIASASNTRISELHYHPASATAAEIAAGYLDQDMFEFVELTNIGVTDINLTNVSFTNGVIFTFPVATVLNPGARIVVVSNQDAFELRYGVGTANIAGEYTGNFRNSGEHVRLEAADDSAIADFTYGDGSPWPESADGHGYSLIFAGSNPANPFAWRSSTDLGGNPGSGNSTPFSGNPAQLLSYALAGPTVPLLDVGGFLLSVPLNLSADDAVVVAEFSEDLVNWTEATSLDLMSRLNNGDGTETLVFRSPLVPLPQNRQFGRVRVDLR